MNSDDAVQAMAALAYGARLDIFRLLVQAGGDGLAAGVIADQCGMSASTLSFHLNQLKAAGLVTNRRVGRSLIYTANQDLVDRLIHFLGETFRPAGSGGGAAAAPAAGITRVLFLGLRNSARSLMAEAILAREGDGRFHALSAGIDPDGAGASAVALGLLHRRHCPTQGLRPKGLTELLAAGLPPVQVAVILCDRIDRVALPPLPGNPVLVNWPLPDPLAVVGTEADIAARYDALFRLLHDRIAALVELPLPAAGDREALARHLAAVSRRALTVGVA